MGEEVQVRTKYAGATSVAVRKVRWRPIPRGISPRCRRTLRKYFSSDQQDEVRSRLRWHKQQIDQLDQCVLWL
jgi:hypothetical protein